MNDYIKKIKLYCLIVILILTILGIIISFYIPGMEKKTTAFATAEKEFIPEKIRIQPNNCSEQKQEINLVLITDSRYTPTTMTSMLSAIKNKCPSSIYNYYIVTENATELDKQSLLSLKQLAPDTVNINIIERPEPDLPYENMQRFLQYKVGMHKIYLPEILKDLDKVIYMDGDTIVLKDLRELYNIDVSNVYASVAKDGIYYRFPKEMAEMGLDKRGFYFNSGVMLYNLDMQRRDNIVEKLVEYIKTHEDFYGDQDVLNVVFEDKLKLMSYRYNCISTFFEADDLNFLSTYYGEPLPKETFYIYENATVLHYAGDKPWDQNYKPWFLKELWYRYYNEMRKL